MNAHQKQFGTILRSLMSALAMFGLAVVVIGCDSSDRFSKTPSPKTFDENPERVRVGMRAVQTNWFFYGAQFGADDWKETESGYQAKRIQRDKNGNPLWEEDFYYSGKTYVDANGGTCWEHITARYDYSSKKLEMFYMGITPGLSDRFPLGDYKASNERKLEKLDETLKAWGLSRN
jgi:hypothetical protein